MDVTLAESWFSCFYLLFMLVSNELFVTEVVGVPRGRAWWQLKLMLQTDCTSCKENVYFSHDCMPDYCMKYTGYAFPMWFGRIYMTSCSVFALELVIISKHVFNNLGLGNAGFRELVLYIYYRQVHSLSTVVSFSINRWHCWKQDCL